MPSFPTWAVRTRESDRSYSVGGYFGDSASGLKINGGLIIHRFSRIQGL